MSEKKICKYCEKEMQKTRMPYDNDFGVDFMHVCFNDECNYYKDGWDWMAKNYNVRASYRYRINPCNGDGGPITVLSPHTFKSSIFE